MSQPFASSVLLYTGGKIEWSDAGGAADTNLYRSAADTLKTDDSLVIGGSLKVSGGSPGTGKVLTSDADGDATWETPAAPAGTAGGALDGTYPNPGLAAAVAGAGLTESSDVLAVGAGAGIAVNANDVAVAPLPYCQIRQAAAQSISNNSFSTAAFDTSDSDNGVATCGTAMADLANDRIYARRTGLYLITFTGNWAANGTGYRWAALNVDGATVFANVNTTFTGYFDAPGPCLSLLYYLASGSYLTVGIYQNSGGSLNLQASANLRACFLGTFS